MLVTLFNDSDSNKTATLQSEIDALPGIDRLKHKPVVSHGEIDEDAERYFNESRLVPSFSFVDPFGYKGLDSKSLAMGRLGISWFETSKENLRTLLPSLPPEDRSRLHRADYDARYQAAILCALLSRPAGVPAPQS